MTLALIAALPFLGAFLPALMLRAGRNASAASAFCVSALGFVLLCFQAPAVLRGEVVLASWQWLPALGLTLGFRLDGLGLLFAGLILGIGMLVILYARFYLAKSDPMGQFYTFLLLFQGAMTGIVLSDNILLLLVFWELTSLSSFLLIGFWSHLPAGRQGARMALAVTGGGGLALIGGMLILGQIAGSYDLSVILTKADLIQSSPLYLPALILILLGAFTKSAQFPFHFWLPHAMAAPTPVSAYLHSATMVKAGIFLMARLWPVLSGSPEWFWIVTGTGLATMLIGAKIAFFQNDLKALLAFSTVSHLGLITMLLGLGTPAAATVAMFHILNHATFKAALFLTAGIVDHETGTRDLARLGGLRRAMPLTFAIAAIASLSMAGVPPLNGFLSKEMMLEETLHAGYGPAWLLPALATFGALWSVAYSLRFLLHGFFGNPAKTPQKPHDPGIGLWAAPALLAGLVVLIGLLPMTSAAWLVNAAASATTGTVVAVKIAHWHGLTAALGMSLAALAGGAVLFALSPRLAALWNAAPRPDAKRIFDSAINGLARSATRLNDAAHDGSFTRATAIAIATITAAALCAFAGGSHAAGSRALLPVTPVPAIGWLLLVTAAALAAILHRNRLLSLLMVGVIGLILSVGFAWLSAPDLALTQITVEVVTVILMLLALHFLPKETPRESTTPRRIRDITLSGAAGLAIAALSYALMTRAPAFPPISAFHLAQSKPGAGGTNAVNTIIVDFRGYDTFGEIIVLGIAALIIFALTESLLAPGPASRRLAAFGASRPARAGDRHPLLMVMATRFLLPFALVVAVFIFLRGHNLPGGGFVAGLVVAIAYLMQYLASGLGWTETRQRIAFHSLIGAGVLVAGLTGAGAWLWGLPFLTSNYGYIHLWPLDAFEWATAAVFDLGVFLTVLGAVMLVLNSLGRLARRAGESVARTPYDLDMGEGL
ncbi:monovalent cation/H+ antiporter subunit A [Paragemmobacter straminiformis]|uniref:Monovalent cation/H+ antiporter subunit A n=1 Tax=Paragemmobacter straminiformis TaxID=2045119 RepID=A0A842IBV0_9RHOB|nr:monovalent cation/H+ antiporter subunit A [Gemmobacter straminiformis]MBC2837059.1 monovalent cation/H+ antiporter subunit A [Gemmobacter straminiformis]